eukprot:1179684-Prorocentrum_minimum.AAC.1
MAYLVASKEQMPGAELLPLGRKVVHDDADKQVHQKEAAEEHEQDEEEHHELVVVSARVLVLTDLRAEPVLSAGISNLTVVIVLETARRLSDQRCEHPGFPGVSFVCNVPVPWTNPSPVRGAGEHRGTAKGPLGFHSSGPMTVKARLSGVSTLCWHASPSTMYTAAEAECQGNKLRVGRW